MKQPVTFGPFTAAPGERIQGMYPILDTKMSFPVTLINGRQEGKTVVLTSGVHGGEYPGIEAAIELSGELQAEEICGQILLAHPVNVSAFYDRVSYIVPEDGKNLNRVFPGDPKGSASEKLAYVIGYELIAKSDFYVDMHGGDLHESLPGYVYYPGVGEEKAVRASEEAAKVLSTAFIVKSDTTNGTYTSAAYHHGVPSVFLERGGRGLWSREEVEAYKADIKNLLRYLKVLPGDFTYPQEKAMEIEEEGEAFAPCDGCWYPFVSLEEKVKRGQVLGEIRDLFGRVQHKVTAEFDGIVIYLVVSLAVNKNAPLIVYGR